MMDGRNEPQPPITIQVPEKADMLNQKEIGFLKTF